MGQMDEYAGYYCLLIAIFCNLDAYESWLMYKHGPTHPVCKRILKKKVSDQLGKVKLSREQMGEQMRLLRLAGYTYDAIADAYGCYPSAVKRRIALAETKKKEKEGGMDASA